MKNIHCGFRRFFRKTIERYKEKKTKMTEKLLNAEVAGQVEEVFAQLSEPVQVLFFGDESGEGYSAETRQLLEEVTALSDKLSLTVYDFQADAGLAAQYRVDKAPSFVIAGRDGEQILDYGIRYAGIPAGHEFSSLIHDLIQVSNRDSGLSPETREFLQGLDQPVHLQVFVTPTCPYCPQAVLLAHRMALESPLVEAEMVEATEFPELADRFHVSGVPQTTINAGAGTVLGAVPEAHLMNEIRKAIKG
jgi:glutaredoxin-like protein